MSHNRLLDHPAALCNIARRAALEAGEITLRYFDESGGVPVDAKTDGSPVTMADREAEAHIVAALRDRVPEVPIIAEESYAAGVRPDLTGQDWFWLVDPLDGTREFITGDGDYTVNIALIRQGVPILGVVYAPARGELYAGYHDGAGNGAAIRWLEETDHEKSIHVRTPLREGLTVTASRHDHGQGPEFDRFLEQFKVAKLTRRGSSLKFCLIAAGKMDLYPRFGSIHEWDTAAGDAILRAAGGGVRDLSGCLLTYGHAGRDFVQPSFIASSFWDGPEDAAEDIK